MATKYIILTCPVCDMKYQKSMGHYNRAIKLGARLFCSHICFGLARRDNKTAEEKKAEKAAYDKKRREDNREAIKIQKAEYYKLHHDRAKEKAYRQKRMPKHVEYCRRPEYKAWKEEYDKQYRAKKDFGEFWQAGLVMIELDKFLDSKRIKYDIGIRNKTQNRKRKWQI
jgi:flagellar biosynthesis GTPase FlhF